MPEATKPQGSVQSIALVQSFLVEGRAVLTCLFFWPWVSSSNGSQWRRLLSHLFTVTVLLLSNSLGEKTLRCAVHREEPPAPTSAEVRWYLLAHRIFHLSLSEGSLTLSGAGRKVGMGPFQPDALLSWQLWLKWTVAAREHGAFLKAPGCPVTWLTITQAWGQQKGKARVGGRPGTQSLAARHSDGECPVQGEGWWTSLKS